MQTTFAILAALASVAITPAAAAPDGCMSSYDGTFEITAYNISTSMKKRELAKRAACVGSGNALVISLNDGVLTDDKGRTGNIAGNHQFQFDNPIQSDSLAQSGFSVCANGSLALGDTTVFYQCESGRPNSDGSFYNLYNAMEFDICSPAQINVIQCGSSGAIGEQTDGQPFGGIATAAPVSQISDGQIQQSTALPVSQISDGQIQNPTATAIPVTQITDGQIQAPTSTVAPISQISDGQVQAPTSTVAPISQISDGQVQAPTATVAPISQISDGQVQAPTATVAPVSQISDGQIQAPTATAVAPISQIGDGQIQAPTGGLNATTVPFLGSANSIKVGAVSVFFGVLAAALL